MSVVSRLSHRFRQHQHLLLLALFTSLFSGLLSHYKVTQTLDWLWFDATQQLSSLPTADDIVIVDIDERSIQQLGRWPWPRNLHAELLQPLASAKAVFFDVIFSDEDSQNPLADEAFAQALKQQQSVVLPLYLERIGHQGQLLEITPAPKFYQAIDAVGHVHVAADEDGVVRSIYLREGVGSAYWPHASLALLNQLHDEAPSFEAEQITDADNSHVIVQQQQRWLPMPNSQQGLIHFSFVDVLEGSVNPDLLAGKIIFVGATASGLGDVFTTSVGNMAGVELNAWAFQALRHEVMITPVESNITTAINSLLVLCLTFFFGRMSPRALLLSTTISISALLIVSSGLQLTINRWISFIPALISIALFYPLWSWRRLEVALNYLRLELGRIRDNNPGVDRENFQHQQKLQRQFWNNLGLDSPQQARLAVEQKPLPISLNKLYGSELVEQTISQISREKELANLNQQLIEKSLAQLQDAVMIADAGGQILFTNQSWRSLFPSNLKDDLLHQLNRIEISGQHSWPKVLASLYIDQPSYSNQGVLDDKIDLFCQLRLSSLSGQASDTLIITLTNVSELKSAERSRLEALNFLSHDLRSPMVSVLAILELQRKKLQRLQKNNANESSEYASTGQLNETINESFLQDIELLVRKNLSYADSFLQLSRAQSLTDDQLQLCDMHAVIDSAQMQGLALAKSKSIELITQRTNLDAWVMGDHDALERAIINLLSNAVKYSDPKTQITLSIGVTESDVVIAVSDQGQGIADKDIDTLFDRFTRGKNAHQEMGAGLGLNYVATVAKRHQGEIQVTSEEGQGSCFTLRIPLERDEL
ncbi:MAG: CHASE2 domain-containing protein [Cellvibrionaceae bacterium]